MKFIFKHIVIPVFVMVIGSLISQSLEGGVVAGIVAELIMIITGSD